MRVKNHVQGSTTVNPRIISLGVYLFLYFLGGGLIRGKGLFERGFSERGQFENLQQRARTVE